jgi:hypothetical protein
LPFESHRVSVTQIEDYLWRLNNLVSFYDQGILYVVRRGYVTDFASVPRFIWWLVPPYGAYTAAAIVHDYLITDALPAGRISSRRVDRVFREAMKELDVSFVRRWLMWAGVRWGALTNPKRRGGWSWLKDAPLVALISVLALPFVLPAVVLLPSALLFSALDRMT